MTDTASTEKGNTSLYLAMGGFKFEVQHPHITL